MGFMDWLLAQYESRQQGIADEEGKVWCGVCKVNHVPPACNPYHRSLDLGKDG
jgi:hypothetical protein